LIGSDGQGIYQGGAPKSLKTGILKFESPDPFHEANTGLSVSQLHTDVVLLGNYVNSVALGDAAVVEKSGFPSYSTERAPDENPPTAPTHLRLKQGELSGSFLARYKPSRRNSSNEVQICTGDPNNEADWHTKGIFLGSRADLEGFTPGIVVWVRVRTVGRKGVMGSWSDPAQIRVV